MRPGSRPAVGQNGKEAERERARSRSDREGQIKRSIDSTEINRHIEREREEERHRHRHRLDGGTEREREREQVPAFMSARCDSELPPCSISHFSSIASSSSVHGRH